MPGSMSPDTVDARDLLVFYADAGVDMLLGEEPVDWLAAAQLGATATAEQPLSPPAAAVPPVVAAAAAPAPAAPDLAVMAAREAARSAASLDELRAILSTFT